MDDHFDSEFNRNRRSFYLRAQNLPPKLKELYSTLKSVIYTQRGFLLMLLGLALSYLSFSKSYELGKESFFNDEEVPKHELMNFFEMNGYQELTLNQNDHFQVEEFRTSKKQIFWLLEGGSFILLKERNEYKVFALKILKTQDYFLSMMQKKQWIYRGSGWKGFVTLKKDLESFRPAISTPKKLLKKLNQIDPRMIRYD